MECQLSQTGFFLLSSFSSFIEAIHLLVLGEDKVSWKEAGSQSLNESQIKYSSSISKQWDELFHVCFHVIEIVWHLQENEYCSQYYNYLTSSLKGCNLDGLGRVEGLPRLNPRKKLGLGWAKSSYNSSIPTRANPRVFHPSCSTRVEPVLRSSWAGWASYSKLLKNKVRLCI